MSNDTMDKLREIVTDIDDVYNNLEGDVIITSSKFN